MYEIWKFCLDKILATLCLVILSPLLLVIAVVIKISHNGYVLIKQTRIGKNGQPFALFRFRTMVYDYDTGIHKRYVSSLIDGTYGRPGEKPTLKLENDPRITTFGRFLRKTSLDEVPQLINVIKGDMSIIGPRPSIFYELEHYKEWHKKRLEVKPGMTGLWQVSGKNKLSFDEMVRLDLFYMEKKSILFDLIILLKTLLMVISGMGYY